MPRSFIAFALLTSLALVPALRAAAPLETGSNYAFMENTAAGTHFWCAFPDFPNDWTVVLYAKQKKDWADSVYTPIAYAIKHRGASGARLCQIFTVPPHTAPQCLLVAYRDGVQMRYMGWTEYNPFGWHTFGLQQSVQCVVSEIPPGTSTRDIDHYERQMKSQWKIPGA